MRVLHVIVNLNPEGGGPQVIALNLAAAHSNLGHEVTLACEEHPLQKEWLIERRKAVPGLPRVNVVPIEVRGSAVSVLLGTASSRGLEELIGVHDFVYLHGVWDPPVKVAGDIARKKGVPYAILVNGMLDPWSLSQRRWKKRFAMTMGYRKFFDGAAFLHLGNADEKKLLEPLKLRPAVEVIPNGVWAEDVVSGVKLGTFRSGYPALAGKPFVLFLSRLHYKKGLDYLAEAFVKVASRLPEAMLVVAGPDGGAREDFQSRIDRAGLGSRVILTGSLYGPAKAQALADADVFCLPSRQEGFSMAILEALGSATPVVISENCHFPEVSAAGAGIVTPLDTDVVADAVTGLLNDPSRAREMGMRGRELVLQRFTWPTIAGLSVRAMERARGSRRSEQ